MYRLLAVFGIIIIMNSCQKEIMDTNLNTPEKIDSTSLPVPESFTNRMLLKRSVFRGTYDGVPGDSIVKDYVYDDGKFLISQTSNLFGEEKYVRDNKERLIEILSPRQNGATANSKVYYQNDTTPKVAYVLSETIAANYTINDSITFTYNGDQVSRIFFDRYSADSLISESYITYEYDAKRNITEIMYFNNGQSNGGYTFEYDNKVNPVYTLDDAFLITELGLLRSPNNVVKQINHYGPPPAPEDNFINTAISYLNTDVPINAVATGSALNGLTQNGPVIGSYEIKYYYY